MILCLQHFIHHVVLFLCKKQLILSVFVCVSVYVSVFLCVCLWVGKRDGSVGSGKGTFRCIIYTIAKCLVSKHIFIHLFQYKMCIFSLFISYKKEKQQNKNQEKCLWLATILEQSVISKQFNYYYGAMSYFFHPLRNIGNIRLYTR